MLPSGSQLDTRLKQVALVLGWLLVAAGTVWALVMVWPIVRWTVRAVSPFLIALVVAYLFNPIVQATQQRFRLGRLMGILVVALLLVLIVLVFFGILLPILYVQFSDVASDIRQAAPGVLEKLTDLATRTGKYLGIENAGQLRERAAQMGKQLDVNLATLAQRFSKAGPQLTQGGARAIGGVFQALGNIVFSLVGFVVTAVLVLVIAFYYLLDFHAIPGLIRQVLPTGSEDRTMEILRKVDRAVGGFLRGQLIVCALVGLLATVGLSLIGMYKYALIVGMFAGAVNFIPYLGPSAGATPAVLWALFSTQHETWPEKLLYAGLVVGLFSLIQTIDGFVFQPRIVGKNANLHPLAVMFALLIGAQFGVSGMILAVPMMCIARVLFRELWWDRHIAAKREEPAPDSAA